MCTYAPFFKLEFTDSEIRAKCLGQGCSRNGPRKPIRVSFGKSFKMHNVKEHITHCHIELATGEHAKTFWEESEKKGGGGGGGGKKRRAVGGGGVVAKVLTPKELAVEKSKYVKQLARMLVTDAQPWGTVMRLGFRLFTGEMGKPSVDESSVRRAYKKLYEAEVEGPIKSHVAHFLKPSEFNIGPAKFKFTTPCTLSQDGWCGRSSEKFVTVILHGHQLIGKVLTRVKVLVRVPHWVPEAGEDGPPRYTARDLARLLKEALDQVGYDNFHLLGITADTDATNFAVLAEEDWDWDHLVFLGCWQHILDLILKDLVKPTSPCPEYVAAREAFTKMTTFIRGSEKNITALLNAQELAPPAGLGLPKKNCVRPSSSSETRFTGDFAMGRRIHRLWPALGVLNSQALLPAQSLFTADVKETFVENFSLLAVNAGPIAMISDITEPILKLSAALGSDSTYTSSIQRSMFFYLNDLFLDALKKPNITPKSAAILERLRVSLYERVCPVVSFKVNPPALFVPPAEGSPHLKRLQNRDDFGNAAESLDPATFVSFGRGGNLSHATNFIYNKVFLAHTEVLDVAEVVVEGGGAIAALKPAAYGKEKAKIKALVNDDPFVSAEVFEERRTAMLVALEEQYGAGKAGGAAAVEVLDGLGPVLKKLKEEMLSLKKYHELAWKDQKGWVKVYGGAFDQGNHKRLSFWGEHKEEMPLLFLAASALLCAPGASTSCERVNSVLGRILSKMRCSLSPSSVERNTLGYAMYRKAAEKASKSEMAVELVREGLLDTDEIVDALLPEPEEEKESDEEEGEGGGGEEEEEEEDEGEEE